MKITLGAAQFGSNYGVTNKKKLLLKEVKQILNFSRKKIHIIDTAIEYNKANKVFSKLNLKSFKINSKIKINKKHENYNLIYKTIVNHLRDLNISKLNYLLIHNTKNFNKFKNKKKILLNLQKLKKANIINDYGISIYENSEFTDFLKMDKPAVIQFPFNVFDRRFLNKKNINLIRKNNIYLQARSCFLQGLLNSKKIPNKFSIYRPLFNKWISWYTQNKILPTEACLLFVNSNKLINEIIVGVSSLHDLKQILRIKIKKKDLKFPFFDNIDNYLIDPRKW